jgi:hypothetical protein
LFAGRSLSVVYYNPTGLDYDLYQIETVKLDGAGAAFEIHDDAVVIARQTIEALDVAQPHTLNVSLSAKT